MLHAIAAAGGKESIACMRCKSAREETRTGQEEVELVFVDVPRAHLNAKCDEEEWVVLTKSDEQTEVGHAMMRTRATQCVDVTKLSTNAL